MTPSRRSPSQTTRSSRSPRPAATFFDERAGSYDRLRPQGASWWARFDALVRLGDLRGRRVLDVGCGTGALAAALDERAGARVWGVDASRGMLEVARGRVPATVGLKEGAAERLPFRDGWFERVVFSLSFHLVERGPALGEAARVLVPAGRVAIATFAAEHFARHWAAAYFPSLPAVDRARFPSEDELRAGLAAAGFEDVALERFETMETLTRADALARLHGRHISTFALLAPAEIAEGVARAERELPETVESRLDQLVVAARLP